MKTMMLPLSAAALLISACSSADETANEATTTDNVIVEEETTLTNTQDSAMSVCDDAGNRYASDAEAQAAGLDPAQYGATYCPEYLAKVDGVHPSWDVNQDGLNDCEDEGICDDSVDYSKPRE
ncbi:hypothetical protein [Sphingomicrobium flavum]|uniref:hypothetical protein n=1 Tax=Sphingomicrobium flavum TaxID=1229164 RepID=UPI0021AE19A5|nr:hypothetical protein [Sphingomicrobium flavum]